MWLPVVYNEVHVSRPAVRISSGPLHSSPPCGSSVVSAFTRIVSVDLLSAVLSPMHHKEPTNQSCNISACAQVRPYCISRPISFDQTLYESIKSIPSRKESNKKLAFIHLHELRKSVTSLFRVEFLLAPIFTPCGSTQGAAPCSFLKINNTQCKLLYISASMLQKM